MKGGVATNLFIMECLHKLNLSLAGDVLFETVIDEEFGGVNGTLAGRVKGFNADAAIISEPSFLRVCPAQRGGRIAHVTLRASGGVLNEGAPTPGVVEQLTFFLAKIKDFGDQRRANAKPHPLYANAADPVPVIVTKIITAPWGTKEPVTVPEECRLEIYWQAMPGEKQEDIDREFLAWIASLASTPAAPFAQPPEVVFTPRWLPGSAISADEPLVTELSECATRVMGKGRRSSLASKARATCMFSILFPTPLLFYGEREAAIPTPRMSTLRSIRWWKRQRCCWSSSTNGVPPADGLTAFACTGDFRATNFFACSACVC